MPINAIINDFMGCESANITAAPIAIVAGPNAQGKSSICTAVAQLLCRTLLPAGVTKGNAGVLVRTGSPKASIMLAAPGGTARVDYPKVALTTEETPPLSSAYAAGLASIVTLPDRERVEVLRGIMKAEPTAEDFRSAATEARLDDKTAAAVWQVIERDGWDSAHKRAQDKGRELKAQWDYATGEKYGEKKAESYMPIGWSAGLDGASKESLEAVVVGARADLEAAISSSAVSLEKRAELEALAAEIEPRKKAVDEAVKAYEGAKGKHTRSVAERDELPTGKGCAPVACPHCGGGLEVRGSGVTKASESAPTAEALERQALAYRAAQQKVDEYAKIVRDAQEAGQKAQHALIEAENAAKKLAGLPPASSAVVDVDAKRTALSVAEADLKAWTRKAEADRIHHAVQANQRIIDLLAPEGVRKATLQRALVAFNERLAAISSACAWKPTAITHDLTVEYGGRPYHPNCSESEQFRARVALQLAVAQMEGSPVVIDGADVLDSTGRSGLFKGLASMKFTAVVGMMANKRDAVPNLAAMNLGHTYWMESGVAREVAA